MSKKQEKGMTSLDPITKRLDALIRLIVEMNKPKSKEKFNEGVAARLLRSVDLSPTEIARILGKKSRTEISKYLYDEERQSTEKDEPEQTESNERGS